MRYPCNLFGKPSSSWVFWGDAQPFRSHTPRRAASESKLAWRKLGPGGLVAVHPRSRAVDPR
jgi:hypothetical protein